MNPLHALLERKLATLDTTLAVVLPGGQRFGSARARVTLTLHQLASLATSRLARSAVSRRTMSRAGSISMAACAS